MALAIPTSTVHTVKRGMTGVPVFSVQRVCNKFGYTTSEDMDFGPATEASVKRVQGRLGLVADGVVGPATQRKIAEYLCQHQEQSNDLPQGLLLSNIMYESGGVLNAVNWTVAGGVDCGITQRRVYQEQYRDDKAVRRAFDAFYQVDLASDRAKELFGIFLARPGCNGNRELAYRVAVLNHNYPTLADSISRVGVAGLTSYYTSPQSWVTGFRLKFPDGAAIRTPLEWGQRYSLGSKAHGEPGQAVKLVRSWS